MGLHTHIFGHVGLAIAATAAMEVAEQENEMAMLRCRFGKTCFVSSRVSVVIASGCANKNVHNPNTLRDLAEIYGTTLDRAYYQWGQEPTLKPVS